ncbi:MAG: hypothetical protein WBD75_03065, partial [Phycisphaerae bacterium]
MARIALVSSAGGHLTQLLTLASELAGEHDFLVCAQGFPVVRGMQLEEVGRIYYTPVYWQYQRPFGVIVSLLASLFMLARVFWKERPDFLITTGAEIGIPALVVGRFLFRRPTLYIESLARIESPSLTGR